MTMIPPPPPPIPGTPMTPGVSAEIPAPPAQVSAPQMPLPPSLPADMPVPGTVPIAQATGEIPTQIPLAVPPSPAPVYVQPAAPPSPPPVAAPPVMEAPVQFAPVAPVQPAPVVPVVPVAQVQEAPTMPDMPAMPAMPAPPPIQAAPAMPQVPQVPQMPAAPQAPQAYQPQPQPAQELMPAQGQPTGMTAMPVIDWDRMGVAEIAEAMGLAGVDFTAYGTTPTISLNQGTFKTSDGTINLGVEFRCRIQNETRPKYLYVTRLADADPNHAVAYSYDHQTSNGKSLREILDSWAQKGIAFDMKTYLEATCVLEDGRVVMLSIPFTSMSRFAGFAQSVILSRRYLSDVVCKVGIGPLITKAARPFNPISFEEVR